MIDLTGYDGFNATDRKLAVLEIEHDFGCMEYGQCKRDYPDEKDDLLRFMGPHHWKIIQERFQLLFQNRYMKSVSTILKMSLVIQLLILFNCIANVFKYNKCAL